MGKPPVSRIDILAQVCSDRLEVEYPKVEQVSEFNGNPMILKEHLHYSANGPPPDLIKDLIVFSAHPKRKRTTWYYTKSERGKKRRLQIKENEMLKTKTIGKKKKKKVSMTKGNISVAQAPGPNPPLHMPTALRNLIQNMGGCDVKLIIEKELYDADVNKVQSRFSMPLKQILSDNFLNDNEKLLLSRTERNNGIAVGFIEPDFGKTTMFLKKRNFTSTSSYVLINNWHRIAVKNKLEEGDTVQAWFFRVEARPWIALVKVYIGSSPLLVSPI